MQSDLVQLLASRSITHPTHIKSIEFADGTLTIILMGYPWWKAHRDFAERATLTMVFGGISKGIFDVSFADGGEDNDEDLENFHVQPLEVIDWAQPCTHHIYGTSPVPNALLLYAVLKDYLIDISAYRPPEDFFNFDFDGKLRRFEELMSFTPYLVARAPESICNVICAELGRQGVTHNAFKAFEASPEKRLWVRLGKGDFLCDPATALFDEGDE